jgi:hypothetical protein
LIRIGYCCSNGDVQIKMPNNYFTTKMKTHLLVYKKRIINSTIPPLGKKAGNTAGYAP